MVAAAVKIIIITFLKYKMRTLIQIISKASSFFPDS